MGTTDEAGAAVGAAPTQTKVLIIGPLPPPAYGVAKATQLMLDSPLLGDHFLLVHLDTSDRSGFGAMGKLTWGNVRLALKHVAGLMMLLRRERPDVMLLTASQGLFGLIRDGLFVALGRAFQVPVLTYLRGSEYANLRDRQGWVAALLLRSIFKHSSRVIVLGESLVEMAHRVDPGCRVAVVTNGCPPAVSPDQVGVRDNDHPLVLFVGRLCPEKGLEEALSVAAAVVSDVPSAEFVLCGEWDSPEYERATRLLVKQRGLEQAMTFPGAVSAEERAQRLAQAWVLLAPSRSEGQPWVILEAMSAGVPVVATDTGAVAETVGVGVAGAVVPVGDISGLAQGVTCLLKDDRLWKHMSMRAVQRYHERFTLERSHAALACEVLLAAQGS